MLTKLKLYNEITHFSLIARRYFINNFYDGMLTNLGILLGYFIPLITNIKVSSIEAVLVILPCLGTSISMLISGISGSYLSERAEQKKERIELDKAMVILDNVEEDNKSITTASNYTEEIQKAMITPIKINSLIDKEVKDKKRKISTRRKKTLHEKAESFTSKIVSAVNGTAPFLGGIVPSIPFFFAEEAGISVFLISFLIILIFIVFLGIFLGIISRESIIRNIFEMTLAFLITFLITFLVLRT
ncbi:MAG: VIT1/CCC1 transporter family protein [Promethearchaeota archaeon]|jgi:VIT1/CCC1 family predicted Fe2+/Mn2+ transporter